MVRSRGFTLIELVMVIILLGIVATISVQFVALSMRGALDVSERQKRALKGVVVSERLTRELRGAVPGSVNVNSSGNCISFLPAVAGGIYKPKESGAGYEPVNEVSGLTAVIASPSGGVNPIDDVTDPSMTSPESRLYYVEAPVRFSWSGGRLYRQTLSDLGDGCSTVDSGEQVLVTSIGPSETGRFFESETPTIRNNSLIHFSFVIDPDSGEPLSFSQTLQVRNVP
ncbi:type II secretion system protein J [Marinobacter sp. LN3S78]|uniref:PulJ/GspJ family protein n=1 Tax=Marinobacter sp. LN3S78 TaxID=3382300 RepID=UPI00387AF4E7